MSFAEGLTYGLGFFLALVLISYLANPFVLGYIYTTARDKIDDFKQGIQSLKDSFSPKNSTVNTTVTPTATPLPPNYPPYAPPRRS